MIIKFYWYRFNFRDAINKCIGVQDSSGQGVYIYLIWYMLLPDNNIMLPLWHSLFYIQCAPTKWPSPLIKHEDKTDPRSFRFKAIPVLNEKLWDMCSWLQMTYSCLSFCLHGKKDKLYELMTMFLLICREEEHVSESAYLRLQQSA